MVYDHHRPAHAAGGGPLGIHFASSHEENGSVLHRALDVLSQRDCPLEWPEGHNPRDERSVGPSSTSRTRRTGDTEHQTQGPARECHRGTCGAVIRSQCDWSDVRAPVAAAPGRDARSIRNYGTRRVYKYSTAKRQLLFGVDEPSPDTRKVTLSASAIDRPACLPPGSLPRLD